MSNQPDSTHHVNPRYRAYGRARLDIAQRARTRQDWDRLWKRPQFSFPFVWGQHWKQCIEYRVDDFASEVGFLIDVLGLPVNAFNAEFAMFTGLNREFYFAVTPAQPDATSTPPDAIRIQFMVDDLFATTEELRRRGVAFDVEPQAVAEGSLQWIAVFRTPHGICMELWGMVEPVEENPALRTAVEPPLDARLPIAEFLPEDQDDLEEETLDEPEEVFTEESGELDEEINEPGIAGDEDESSGPTAPLPPTRSASPADRQPRVFTDSQEILAHLQGKATPAGQVPLKPRLSTDAPPQLSGPGAFRPAPKPQPSQSQLEEDQPPDAVEEEHPALEDNHYKRITFHKD